MRRLLGLMMVGLLFAGTAAACSSDDDGGDGDTTETTAAEGGDSGDSGGGENADVEDFCTQAEELGEQLQAAVDDPTSADAAEITQQAADLSAAAAELSSANPDDVDRINECAAELQVTP